MVECANQDISMAKTVGFRTTKKLYTRHFRQLLRKVTGGKPLQKPQNNFKRRPTGPFCKGIGPLSTGKTMTEVTMANVDAVGRLGSPGNNVTHLSPEKQGWTKSS